MSTRRVASHFHLRRAFDTKQWGPFQFEIDRPKGFVKTWDLPDGSKKTYEYPVDYGYFVGHTGEDDEGLDAFVGSDPAAPIESFLKLMPGPDGGLVPDETKFLVGLTPEERVKVMALYKPEEVVGMRTYTDFYDLLASLNAFRTRKQAALRVASLAMANPRAAAPKVLSEDQLKALMEKVRKGATTSFSFAQTTAVIEALGGTITPVVVMQPLEREPGKWLHLRGQDGPTAVADRDAEMAEIRKRLVSTLPANPKVGVLYVTDVQPWEGHSGYVGLEIRGGYGVPAFEVKLGNDHGIATDPYARPEGGILGQLTGGGAPVKAKDLMMSTYVLPKWLDDNTQWKALAAGFLNKEVHVPGAKRTVANTGTCGYCFQNVKLKNGSTVLHGYRRPGTGVTEGQCQGRGLAPFELSVEATELHRQDLEDVIRQQTGYLQRLKDGKIQSVYDYNQREVKSTDPYWPQQLRIAIERTEREIEALEEEHKVFQTLVGHWKVRPLPVEGDWQINWFIEGRKASMVERVAAMHLEARTLVCGVCGSQLLGSEDGEAKHSCPKCKTAAKTYSPDDVKALMMKIRKGVMNQSPAELTAVLEALGWTVTPTVGLKTTDDGTFFYAHTPAQADEMMALLAKAKVSSWPVNPKSGGVYITEYSRSPAAGNGETVDYKGAVGLPGVILKDPRGVSGIALASYSAEPHRYLNGDARKKPTLGGTDMIWWLEKNAPSWKEDVLAYLNMEEHVPANARTKDRTGTCGICFQNVKLAPGNHGLALHGFKRPGGGYTQGECPGMRFPPFELSVDATAAHLRGLEAALKGAEAAAGDLEQQSLARKLRTDIAIFQALVDHWKPRPLPVEGEKMQNWYDRGRMASVVAGRFLEADLSPPLGGGPCRVVERIEDTVRDPKLRDKMIEDVEQGHSLANEESKKVYPFSRERGSFFKTFTLVPHAAYRMDWRGVTVKDVEAALNSFAAHMKALKEKRDPAYERTLTQSEIAWVDPKTKLQVVFGVSREGEVKVISAYWKGEPDPRPMACNVDRVAARFLAGD